MAFEALHFGKGMKFVQHRITAIVGRVKSWTEGSRISLKKIGFHPNRQLGTTEKHRCKI